LTISYSICFLFLWQRNSTIVSLHSHLTRLLSVSWLSTIQRERVDRCIHIVSLIADRRGLIHFLRSNHSSISDVPTRSRRTSRSATSEHRHSNDFLLDLDNQSNNQEHKRVADSFVVRKGKTSSDKIFFFHFHRNFLHKSAIDWVHWYRQK